ncbi:MAG: dihydrofolate reductase [Microbacterium sp.]|nr:dihydrofolate reductase [Microbacterium sp.]
MTPAATSGVGLVWAEAAGGVIGARGGIPWHLPEDLAHFRDVTMGAPVIMGRKTWDSLPERFRPLPGRRNIVVTRASAWTAPGAETAGSLAEALGSVGQTGSADPVWVNGGGELFRDALGEADVLEITEVDLVVPGDTFAPSRAGFTTAHVDPAEGWHTSHSGIRYRFLTLVRDGATGGAID